MDEIKKTEEKKIRLAIADDHVLLRKALVQMLVQSGISVVAEADNGEELIEKIKTCVPDIVLMDISMPVMDGVDATRWIKKNMPHVRVLTLSMFDDETRIIRMIRSGARGYLLKDCEPAELKKAIREIVQKGFYYSDLITIPLLNSIQSETPAQVDETSIVLNPREELFLRLVCTEMSYKEIALEMNTSPRTIDGYRDALFARYHIKSRVGLVMFAIRMRLFDPFNT